jgi:hypothetical protein
MVILKNHNMDLIQRDMRSVSITTFNKQQNKLRTSKSRDEQHFTVIRHYEFEFEMTTANLHTHQSTSLEKL